MLGNPGRPEPKGLDSLPGQAYIRGMNKLSSAKRVAVVAALVEGNSIRATVRMTGVAKNTVAKLLVDLGRACAAFQSEALVNLKCRRIQCDEIWSFVYAKERNADPAMKAAGTAGDVWTWTAMDADTKLMVSWLVGGRDAGYATEFMEDVASRLATRVQVTTDGLKLYLEAVEGAFGMNVDFAQLVKIYGEAPEGQRRYSPAEVTGCRREVVAGNPDPAHISTSYVERQNLTMRMGMRRFTRLTNGFSKKVENLEAAVALHYMHYNFARVHQSLRVTPAMEAGVADHVWTLADIVALLD
jgi:IS1 family transposase